MSQIPEKDFPQDKLSQQGKTLTSLQVRAMPSPAILEPDIDIGIC